MTKAGQGLQPELFVASPRGHHIQGCPCHKNTSAMICRFLQAYLYWQDGGVRIQEVGDIDALSALLHCLFMFVHTFL